MGCGLTLVRRAKGPFTPEVLKIQCMHEDIREYWMKLVTIGIGDQTFTCRAGILPRLDCGVLIGCDCSLLMQLLWKMSPTPRQGATKALQAETLEAEGQGVELPVYREDISWLTQEDPLLRFARASACKHPPPATEKAPAFLIDHGVLHRWVESKSQLVVPGLLRAWVMSLAHHSPLVAI